MKTAARLLIALLTLVGAQFLAACAPGQGASGTDRTFVAYEFANAERLREHYLKHRGEFEAGITEAQYLDRARQFFNSSDKAILTKFESASGDTLRYRERTNEFGVISKWKKIRTYFRPRDGIRYWNRQ